jgi:hypothetical protein
MWATQVLPYAWHDSSFWLSAGEARLETSRSDALLTGKADEEGCVPVPRDTFSEVRKRGARSPETGKSVKHESRGRHGPRTRRWAASWRSSSCPMTWPKTRTKLLLHGDSYGGNV